MDTGAGTGGTDCLFPAVPVCTLSDRCPGWVRGRTGGKFAGCVGCEDEAGKYKKVKCEQR